VAPNRSSVVTIERALSSARIRAQKLAQETVRRRHSDGHARLLLCFFPSPLDLSVELLAAEVIASLDETFPHPSSLSLSFLFPAFRQEMPLKIFYAKGGQRGAGRRFFQICGQFRERKKERKRKKEEKEGKRG